MERTDWLDQGYDSAVARFLMLTAITHHQFDSPIWGQDEVRKLHLELTEIDLLTTRAAVEDADGRARRRLERAFLERARIDVDHGSWRFWLAPVLGRCSCAAFSSTTTRRSSKSRAMF
jgi:hypothetical protein